MAYRRGKFWYRSEREGGRVVTRYLGAGDLAAMLAGLDAEAQAVRQAQQAAERTDRAEHAAAEAALIEHGRLARAAMTAALLAGGYHLHSRQWRKRRR